MVRLRTVAAWAFALIPIFIFLVTGIIALLVNVASLYSPNPSVFWQRQVFWTGTLIAFILSAFWAWGKLFYDNRNLKATVQQLTDDLLESRAQKEALEKSNAELTENISIQQEEIESLNGRLAPALTLSAPFIELTRYQHGSVQSQSEYFHIARVTVHNPGSVGVSRIRVIAKDFIWRHEDYSGKPFYPKDDFSTHSDGSFYLEAGGTKHVDIALRQPSTVVGHGAPMTYFRLAIPPYMSNLVGDNEIIGLTIQVVAPGYPQTPEQRLDLYLEKQPVTSSTGEVKYQKILRVRASEFPASSSTEVRMWQEPAAEEPGPDPSVP